jgi:hypothetical protein
MTNTQTLVGVALVIVLSFIAFELDGIRRNLTPGSSWNAISASLATPRDETREQRTRRIQREQQQLQLDLDAIWSTPDAHKKPLK